MTTVMSIRHYQRCVVVRKRPPLRYLSANGRPSCAYLLLEIHNTVLDNLEIFLVLFPQ